MNDYLIPLTSACTLVTLNYIAMKIRNKMLIDTYEDKIAPLFTGLASMIMMFQPLPPQLGLTDLRSLPIFMAGLRYGLPVALLSTLPPALYSYYFQESNWLFMFIQHLVVPALVSSYYHNKEYRSGFMDIRIRHGLYICVSLFMIQLLFSFFMEQTISPSFVAGQLFMLAITTGAFIVLIVMVNDENKGWRLQRQLELQANQDGLTRLPNLRSFSSITADAMKKRKVAIFMIDIDNFKQFNDQLGHLEGDRLLRDIGGLLRNSIYEQDYVARYGGEEFILMSMETDPEQLSEYASHLCETVKLHSERQREYASRSITISIGISIAKQPQADLQQLISEADQALYQSKRAGKNCYTFYKNLLHIEKKMNAH